MPPANFKRKWIKLFIDECLTGTIREDLTPDERSVWYDFLLFSGRNRPPGYISANENTAISPKRLAAILNIPVSLLARATKKFEDSGRIEITDSGIIVIINWDKYQFTDYDRQKPYRKPLEVTPPASDFDTFVEEMRPKYPDLNLDTELEKFNLYWSEGNRKLKRPKLALRNWLDRAMKPRSNWGNNGPEPKPVAATEPEVERFKDEKGDKYYIDPGTGMKVY